MFAEVLKKSLVMRNSSRFRHNISKEKKKTTTYIFFCFLLLVAFIYLTEHFHFVFISETVKRRREKTKYIEREKKKMIHDAANQAASSVPEELYNLTQLADVTLAAGKLSTTNIQTIKDYIRSEESIAPATPHITNRPLQMTELVVIKRSNSSDASASDTSSATNSPQKLLSDAGYMSDMEYFDKKTFLYALHSNHSQSMDTDTSMADSCAASIKSSFSEQRQSSFSSSEDDSTYNYSHKIFDKRKSRKLHCQTQNTETALKSANPFNSNAMVIETEDSMLSISETESNDGDGRQKIKSNLMVDDDINLREKMSADLTSETESMTSNCGTEDVHTCPECGKKYSTSSNLARHRQTHRSLLDKKARRCPHCDKGKFYK